MKHPGEDIRYARSIFEIIYGEQETWKEINVKRWMTEANKIVKELRVNTYHEALKQLIQIPTNILKS